jgi:hypothetical protein
MMTKAQADAFTKELAKLVAWTERSIELIATMAADAYREQIWELYDDCDSWSSYVKNHLHTNRIKLTVSERRGVVVKLYHDHMLTQQETADVLGVSKNTVTRDLEVSQVGIPPERGGRPRKTRDVALDDYPPEIVEATESAGRTERERRARRKDGQDVVLIMGKLIISLVDIRDGELAPESHPWVDRFFELTKEIEEKYEQRGGRGRKPTIRGELVKSGELADVIQINR